MADAYSYSDSIGSAEQAVAAAVVVSPLLNLAPSCASGPTLVQNRPVLPLGTSSLRGRATLTLAPDRRSMEVSVDLRGAALPTAIRLRRVASHHLRGGSESYESDLLLLEVIAGTHAPVDYCLQEHFSLEDRGSFLPFERVSELRTLGIDVSELIASSIDGLSVEGAPDASSSGLKVKGYFAERMLMEIKAAERSAGVAAACRHLELANLYARRLGSSEPHSAS